jgi:hypothetical protein
MPTEDRKRAKTIATDVIDVLTDAEERRLAEARTRSRAYRWGEDGLAGISDEALQIVRSY